MTSRQRVLEALARQRPDRAPVDYWAEPCVTERLLKDLRLQDQDELLERLNVDIRVLAASEPPVRELPGGRCVSLMHKGPYDELGRSYEKILAYIREKGYQTLLPSREVYIKGPGMILKGNPEKYLTEIQIMIQEEAENG